LGTVSLARSAFENCGEIYPEFAELADEVCESLWGVFAAAVDPLGSSIAELIGTLRDCKLAVLLANHGYESLVERHLRDLSKTDVDVITAHHLATRRPYDVLVVVGAPSWYVRGGDGWVFTSPRASEVALVGFRPHASESIPTATAFSVSRSRTTQVVHDQPAQHEAEWPTDIVIETDWTWIPADAERRRSEAAPADLVEARLCVLSTGSATFVSASEDARVQTLDLDSPPGRRLVALPPSEIGPGTFLLLRVSGGGDFIVEVADAILGTETARLRGKQVEWKLRLSEQVAALGTDAVVGRLRDFGSKIADRGNLANWCSPRSLRTDSRSDFDAILKLVGLDQEADEYWKAMAELESAHRKAGFAIRRRLDALAEGVDAAILDQAGRFDFQLQEGGGTLAAFRVEAISPVPVEVAYDELGALFESTIGT
jgi:hypothetical protein